MTANELRDNQSLSDDQLSDEQLENELEQVVSDGDEGNASVLVADGSGGTQPPGHSSAPPPFAPPADTSLIC